MPHAFDSIVRLELINVGLVSYFHALITNVGCLVDEQCWTYIDGGT